jgi:hypothetical protein
MDDIEVVRILRRKRLLLAPKLGAVDITAVASPAI